jgi:hypothetical protein
MTFYYASDVLLCNYASALHATRITLHATRYYATWNFNENDQLQSRSNYFIGVTIIVTVDFISRFRSQNNNLQFRRSSELQTKNR